MPQNNSFTIYNASAGSGKTFTLVKSYLKILLRSNNLQQFKRILAITFTNKAVTEMKARIIDTLKQFSNETILSKPNALFLSISEELDMPASVLHQKSKTLLNTIIHNYAAFDISTIDGFTHNLIRTFAYDLKLPLNFEVELDQDALLFEAVDSLIAKAGTDKALTAVLVDFALEKADDDKSWDVSYDFNKIAKRLFIENDLPFLETFKDKTLNDFNALKKQLKTDIALIKTDITETAKSTLTLIEDAGLKINDFSRKTLPNHFIKASELDLSGLYNNKLEENIVNRSGIYNKTIKPDLANTIDSILPQIEAYYKTIKRAVYHLKFLKAFYKNITPLSVLNSINKELETLKTDQNKMLISEFNSIISKEIRNQPTPFIYERIGEKFKHYFIDEFQDTSTLQWENLMPLIANSLATENGSALLVGDAKQAIYSWRGGKASQFIDLFNKKVTPFTTVQTIQDLTANYRSFKNIVTFNNGFFKQVAAQFFTKTEYQNLYENAHQKIVFEEAGYVSLDFLDLEKDADRVVLFCEKVLQTIKSCQENDFNLYDICILVRKKKEGVAIANYLSDNEIPIISSETLLVKNAPEIIFINNVLALLIQPKNNEIKIALLDYLATRFLIEDKHAYFNQHLNLTLNQLFKSFETFKIYINSQNLLQLPLYDLVETLVRSFNLVEISNAYIQFYLDIVLDFSQKKGSDISAFLNYFNQKKEKLSIVSPQGQNAVQIMTIHKSKGLEFPVVIFPFSDLDIYKDIESKEWFPINKDSYKGFNYTLIDFNPKDFENFGDVGIHIANNHKWEQELDNINLLYVVLTRAIEQLYIISKKDISAKGEINTKKYSGLFISYLDYLGLWNTNTLHYSFGNTQRETKKETIIHKTVLNKFIATAKETHNINVVTKSGLLWDTSQKESLEKGNLIHDILAAIKTKDDVNSAINQFISNGTITLEQSKTLKNSILEIVNHSELKQFYSLNNTVYNERDIITKDGIIIRPDRVVINSAHEATIIDYKTGAEAIKHWQQLTLYEDALKAMNIKTIKKILVYVNDSITVKILKPAQNI